MVTSAISIFCSPAFFWRETIVVFSVLAVVVSSLAALLLLAASVLVAPSVSRTVLLGLAVPLPPLFLLLFCFSGSV